jgi:8-oxo-dGTP diphosphatase
VEYAHTCEAVIDEDNHWITVFMRAEVTRATQPVNLEPDKCEGWEWVKWDGVGMPRFKPLDIILNSRYTPFAPTEEGGAE